MLPVAVPLLACGAYLAGEAPAYRAFTARVRTQYWTESGRTTSDLSTFARKSDGSVAKLGEAEAAKGKRGSYVDIYDASRQRTILSAPLLAAALVMPVPDPAERQRIVDAYGSCKNLQDGTWVVKGRSRMLGLQVIEVEVQRTAREIVTHWVAPELQCFSLKQTDVMDGELRVEMKVLSLEMKEPPESMFRLPAGYVRMTPLELEDRYEAEFGAVFWGREVAERLQRQYERAVAESKER